MYRLIPLLFILRLIVAHDIQPVICDGVVLGKQYYERQMLFGTLNTPTNLMMHKYSGELFFSHTVRDGVKYDLVIRVCNIDTRSCKDIKEVPGGIAIAYDRVNDNVYFGGRNGIYKYVPATQSAHFYTAPGRSIWDILIHKYLYFIENKTKKLFIYKHGQFTMVAQFKDVQMDTFFISKHLSVFFSNVTGLYKSDRINKPVHAVDTSIKVKQINQYYHSPRVYFAGNDGIYLMHDTATKQAQLKKAVDMTPLFGITFRNTTDSKYEPIQFIYSDKHSIFKLTPSKQKEVCLKQLRISRSKSKGVKPIYRAKKESRAFLGKSKSKPLVRRAHRVMLVDGQTLNIHNDNIY